MSAYLVSKGHIDSLVEAANRYSQEFGITWSDGASRQQFKRMVLSQYQSGHVIGGADDLGAMLWLENLQSVSERYPDDQDGERPGPVGLTTVQMLAYTYASPRKSLTPVEALKALACYEYQSCEHLEGEQSEAHDFCESLRHVLISALPGYDEAKWGIDE